MHSFIYVYAICTHTLTYRYYKALQSYYLLLKVKTHTWDSTFSPDPTGNNSPCTGTQNSCETDTLKQGEKTALRGLPLFPLFTNGMTQWTCSLPIPEKRGVHCQQSSPALLDHTQPGPCSGAEPQGTLNEWMQEGLPQHPVQTLRHTNRNMKEPEPGQYTKWFSWDAPEIASSQAPAFAMTWCHYGLGRNTSVAPTAQPCQHRHFTFKWGLEGTTDPTDIGNKMFFPFVKSTLLTKF